MIFWRKCKKTCIIGVENDFTTFDAKNEKFILDFKGACHMEFFQKTITVEVEV